MALLRAALLSGIAAVASTLVAEPGFQQFALQRRLVPARGHVLSGRHRRAQDEAPIYGDFKHLAYFYADVYIGTPPQKFTVITDTGSSLTAVPCADCGDCGAHMNPRFDPSKSSTKALVACDAGCPGGTSCAVGRCQYTQSYAEGSSLRGVLYRDTTYIGAEGAGSAEQASFAIPFAFGCGNHEGGLFVTQEADGIMGLGQGDLSVTRALWASSKLQQNMFSLCLSFSGGALTMGAMDPRLHSGPIAWAKMSLGGFYVVTVTGCDIAGASCLAGDFNSPHTILDSGTTFTYVPSPAYQRIRDQIHSWCGFSADRCHGTVTTVQNEPLCYRLTNPDDVDTFPSMRFNLAGAVEGTTVALELPPRHVFVNMGWDQGAYCLAIYDNGSRGGVIGANAMMGSDVIFDLTGIPATGPRAGFAPSTCVIPAAASETPTSSPSPPPTGSDSPSGTPPPSPSEGAVPVTPSPSPEAPSTSASPSPAIATEGKDGATDTPRAGSTSGSAILGAGIVGSVLLVCLMLYFCMSCECSVGRFTLRLGRGGAGASKGKYTVVEPSLDIEEEEEEGESEAVPGTGRPRRGGRGATSSSSRIAPGGRVARGGQPKALTSVVVDKFPQPSRVASVTSTTL